jgi:hypothetical protein
MAVDGYLLKISNSTLTLTNLDKFAIFTRIFQRFSKKKIKSYEMVKKLFPFLWTLCLTLFYVCKKKKSNSYFEPYLAELQEFSNVCSRKILRVLRNF